MMTTDMHRLASEPHGTQHFNGSVH
uniref:Uncharacterized protein n=1 Tax=Anguilla anguilla TaxID=7936 RepID=A0A0E9W1A0_ANGAN